MTMLPSKDEVRGAARRAEERVQCAVEGHVWPKRGGRFHPRYVVCERCFMANDLRGDDAATVRLRERLGVEEPT